MVLERKIAYIDLNKTRAEHFPFDTLSVFREEAFHCDLCSGNPQCVKVCTPGAIQIIK